MVVLCVIQRLAVSLCKLASAAVGLLQLTVAVLKSLYARIDTVVGAVHDARVTLIVVLDLPDRHDLHRYHCVAIEQPLMPMLEQSAKRSRLSRQAVTGLAVMVIPLAVAWHHTFAEMWLRWFPAWRADGMTLYERLTQGDSYYSHGPLVLLGSLWLTIRAYKRDGLPILRTRASTIFAWSVVIAFLLLHLLSLYARITFISGFALIGMLAGLLLWWGGRPLAKVYWVPVVLLVFMVPLPLNLVADLNYELKTRAAEAAVWVTNDLFGIPAVLDGSYIHLEPGDDNQLKSLLIDNVCSGLRSLIALTWFASMFSLVSRVGGAWRCLMLAMALPVAVACNILRITFMTIVDHYFGVGGDQANRLVGFHALSGLLMFCMAMGVLFSFERLILSRSAPTGNESPPPSRSPSLARTVPLGIRPSLLGLLAVGAFASVVLSRPAEGRSFPVHANVASAALPQEFGIGNGVFVGRDVPSHRMTSVVLETDDYACRRYIDPRSRRTVEILVIYSDRNRKAFHPPNACLSGSGEFIRHQQTHPLRLPGIGDLVLQEVVSQRGSRMTLYLYVYKCGRRYTSSFVTQQAAIFLNGLTTRKPDGALIRIGVSVVRHDVAGARRLALAAAEAIIPYIDERLP